MIDFQILTFAEAPQPKFTDNRKGWTNYGEDNLYPQYLLDLFNKSPKNGAILQNKICYVNGRGWKQEDEGDLFAKSFIQSINENESLYEVSSKCVTDFEIFNGFYLQINWAVLGGKIASIYHLDYCKVRTNKDNTQFWYKEDWTKTQDKADVYPAFDLDNRAGTQILYVKGYRPNMDAYSIPNYISALNYIQSDVEVSKHTLGNAKSGFSPSKQVTFVNGEPESEEAKRIITKRFQQKFTGSEGSKIVVEFVKSKDQQTLITDLGQSDLTKEDFTAVNNLIQQEIFSGHRVTSPILFGIKTEGQLGGNTELINSYEIFKNTYSNERQMAIEEVFNYLASLKGVKSKIKIIDVAPISQNALDPAFLTYLPKEFILEKLGVDLNKYQVVSEQSAQPINSNDNIKNLTGRQHQNIDRIVRKVNQGKLSKEQAIMLLKSGYGLSDEEANTMLSVQSNFSDEDVISVFEQFGENKKDYIVLKNSKKLESFIEDELFRMDFEDDFTKLEADVLGLIDKNKLIDNEAIATALKIDVSEVEGIIESLLDKEAITQRPNKLGTLETTLTKPLSELVDTKPQTTSFRVMYSYDWRKEIPRGQRNSSTHPSRPFCVKMMSLDRLYTRTDIESISAKLGYDVFTRVGGFWNNGGEVEYHCRHDWGARLVVKKNKK